MQMFRSFLAVLAVTMGVSTLRADVIIDDFTVTTPFTSYSLAAPVPSTFSQTDAIGGGITRGVVVTQVVNSSTPLSGDQTSGTLGAGALPASLGNGFTMSTTVFATANAVLSYTYSSAADLVTPGATAIQFRTVQSDLNVPYTVSITGSSGTVTVGGLIPASNTSFPATISSPLSSFSGAGLDGVTNVTLSINTGSNAIQSADLALTDLRFVAPPPTSVPAPAAVFLLLAAAPALGFRSVRSKLGLA